MKTTLYNCQSNNCCAYCRKHNCHLTVKQMRTRECLKKQCWYLVKNENHDYWRQREQIKQKRKTRKQTINEYLSQFQGKDLYV